MKTESSRNQTTLQAIFIYSIIAFVTFLLASICGATAMNPVDSQQNFADISCSLSNIYPRPGEIVDATILMKFNSFVNGDIIFVAKYAKKGKYRPPVLEGDTLITEVNTTPGDKKTIKIKIILNEHPTHGEGCGVWGGIKRGTARSKDGKLLTPLLMLPNAGAGIYLMYDSLSGCFVPSEEWIKRDEKLKRDKPEYTYDVIQGIYIKELLPDKVAKKLRIQIESLKQFDPTLSDEEALEMLHDTEYEMVVRYGIHNREESLPILLKARVLLKERNISKWDAVDKLVKEINQNQQRKKIIAFSFVSSFIALLLILLIAYLRRRKRQSK